MSSPLVIVGSMSRRCRIVGDCMSRCSFFGDARLKASLLTCVEERRDQGSLQLFELRGALVAPFEYAARDTYRECADILAVPEPLLRLGAWLVQGLPEDPKSTRTHLEGALRFLRAIPLGLDLTRVVPELLFWRLTDAEYGVVNAVSDARRRLVEDAACVQLGHESDPSELGDEIQTALDDLGEEVRATWQRDRSVRLGAYAEIPALEAALAALDPSPKGVIRVVEAAERVPQGACPAVSNATERRLFSLLAEL